MYPLSLGYFNFNSIPVALECKISYNTYKFSRRGIAMADKFTRIPFERMFNVEKIITLFYMEMSKNFHYDGESHDFWEMVYID